MNELNQILFQRYLDGDLAASEKEALEKQLQEDQAFRTDFELFQAMDVFLHKKVRQGGALNQLREVHKEQVGKSEEKTEPKRRRLFPIYKYASAAVVAGLILFFGWWIMQINQQNTIHSVIVDNHLDKPLSSITRSISDAKSSLDSAFYYFELNEYELSKDLFLSTQMKSDTIDFYLANIYFINNQLEKSKNQLKNISSQSTFTYQASILLGYIHIIKNEKQSAEKHFNKVPESILPYEEKSKLLKLMDN